MTDAAAPIEEAPVPPAPPANPRPVTALAIAGLASLGAGAIHAAAIGVHNEHQSVVVTFALVAAFQLAWGAGALALRSSPRSFLAVGVVGQGAVAVGWLLTKTTGIGFVTGLDQSESVQLADGVAAALALVAVALAARELLVPAGRPRAARQILLPLTALPVAALAVASMVSVDSHSHAGGHGHGDEAAADHGHGGDDAAHEAAANLGPFDPEEAIDLSGVPGVTPEQEESAEALLQRSLDKLPQFSDLSTLNDKGFYSIGDALTGDEHYINWSYVDDDKVLDPDYPESLVIRHEDGREPYLAAAMYMLPTGTTLDDVPDVGGPLVQWHVHNDICLTDDPVKPTLAFADLLVAAEKGCTPPNSKRANVPMVHVWIVPHPCGPFAALEGIGGGQVAEGEEKLCTAEHAHATES